MRGLVALVLGAGFLLSGCTSPPTGNATSSASPLTTTSSSLAAGRETMENFDGWTNGSLGSGWVASGGTWGGAANASAPGHARVVEGSGVDEVNNLVANVGGSFSDFEANVSFDMVSGDHPQGAGMSFHYQDANNYQIIRYSLSEQGWHLFTMHQGNRDKKPEGTVPGNTTSPQFHTWVFLRVVSKGGHVTAFDGDVKVIDYMLPAEVVHAGAVALFVRGNTVAAFDDFHVRPLP